MATMDLGIIRVVIGADTRPLEEGTRKVNKAARSIAGRIEGLSRRLSATFFRVTPWMTVAGAVLAVGAALKSIGQDSRELETLSIMTGTSVTRLTELKFAMEGVGGSMQDLTAASNNFADALRSSITDQTNAARLALDAIGISARNADGSFKTLDELLPDIAQKFNAWEDGAGKASIATALFGDQAANMTRLLNQGKAGLDQATAEAKEWNRSSADAAQKAKEWNDNLAKLTRELIWLRDDVLGPLLPHLTKLIGWFKTGAVALGEFTMKLRDAFSVPALSAATAIKQYEDEISNLMASLDALHRQNTGDATDAHNHIVAQIEERKQRIEELKLSITQTPEGWTATLNFASPKTKPREIVPADTARDINRALAHIDELTARLDGLPDRQRSLLEQMIAGNATSYESVQAAIDEVIANYKLEEDQVRRLHGLKRDLLKAQQDTLLDTVAMFGSTLSALFKKSKAIAAAETVIHTSVAVMRALKDVPWPLNLAQAAFVAAQGAAQLAAINSTNENGSGSVRAPSSNAPSAQGGAMSIMGVNRNHLYSGNQVSAMLTAMNDALQGGTTTFATA